MQIHPRILVLDPTPIGSLCATGAFKQMLFAGWPPERILEFTCSSQNHEILRQGLAEEQSFSTTKGALEAIRRFDPEVLYVRPELAAYAHFTGLLEILCALDRPAALHIMDDWVVGDLLPLPSARAALVDVVKAMGRRCALRFTDGPAYVADFGARLSLPFQNMLNAVDVDVWSGSTAAPSEDRPFTLVYMGNFDKVMSRQAVLDVAEAVDELKTEFPIRFDVCVRDYLVADARRRLARFSSAHVLEQQIDYSVYVARARSADVNVYAYNCDAASLRYMAKGIPNKTAELFAARRPILAYGSLSMAAFGYLRDLDAAHVVAEKADLRSVIRRLYAGRLQADSKIENAFSAALRDHDASQVRARFANELAMLAADRSRPAHESGAQLTGAVAQWDRKVRPFLAAANLLKRARALPARIPHKLWTFGKAVAVRTLRGKRGADHRSTATTITEPAPGAK